MNEAQRLPASSDQVDTERMFIALTLPDPVRQILALLPQDIPGFVWTRPEQMHVTLRFLGNVPVDRIDAIVGRLREVRVAPFVLPLEGVGTFPPNRPPRVLWLGTGNGHPRLFQLRQRIDDALLGAGLDLDVRTFHPHITLARLTENAASAATRWAHAHHELSAPPIRVDAFDLYASEPRPTGAIHTLCHRFPLAVEP